MKTIVNFPQALMAIALPLMLACNASKETTAEIDYEEQVIPVETPDGIFNVWTKRNGSNPSMRLLLLHGGPGATHEYFEVLEKHFPDEGIEFIYYDQLGSGNSDNPDDTLFWNIPRFVDEVEQVRTMLGLNKDNFYLLGHSWGGILAMEYALKHQNNLKGLIISNMMSSCTDYGKYADDVLAKGFDQDVLNRIKELEAAGDYDNPEYMDLLMEHHYTKHVLRKPIDEWPDAVNRAFEKLNYGLYVYMQGPSEFGIAGTLANWDRKEDLSKINVPTLVIAADHDTMDPEHMRWMSEQLPQGQLLQCPNGSHMAMWDDEEVYAKGLINFIKGVNQ